MDAFNDIIARLEKQRQAIESALNALREVDETATAATEPRVKRTYTRRAAVKKSGGISEEGRKRLADAMKKRWAVKHAAAAAKKTARKKAVAKKAVAKKAVAKKAVAVAKNAAAATDSV
jgi:hypothetical protein